MKYSAGTRRYARFVRCFRRKPVLLGLVRQVRRHPGACEWGAIIVEAAVMYMLIASFVVQAYAIPSRSMVKTLEVGDRIFVNKFIFRFKNPEHGDVVVFRPPDKIFDPQKPQYVKRVVGLPGDRIEIRADRNSTKGNLLINGKLPPKGSTLRKIRYGTVIRDPYVRVFKGADIPEGQIYCFGDNTDESSDSRTWGAVPLEYLKGKAFFRFWPLHRFGSLE